MDIMNAIMHILQPAIMLYMLIGVAVGAIIGALPGLSVVMAISILTPLTFFLAPDQGLAMLIGIYNGGVWAGGISAILINTPGTPASIMSTLDGYAMTKRGEAGLALGINTIYSVMGGLFSTFILSIAAFPLANFALRFGPPEYFALALFGLSMMISVSEKSIVKGLLVGFVGFLISTVGLDSMYAFQRFTFGNENLLTGIPFIAVMIGLFGAGEVFYQVYENDHKTMTGIKIKIGRIIPTFKEFKKYGFVSAITAVISVIIGAIPGTGGDIASIVCWDTCKKISKDSENYGKGSAEGLAVTCLANNGVIGGALTTMLTLGIPGDAVTAVLIGSLMMYGLQPGPMLFVEHKSFVYGIIAMMIIANIIILVFGLLTTKISAKFLNLKQQTIWIGVMVLCVIGSFAINNSLSDVWIMFTAGIFGFILRQFDFPVAPLILAIILGPLAESNLRRSLALSNGSYSIFLTSPIALVLLFVTALAIFGPILKKLLFHKKIAKA